MRVLLSLAVALTLGCGGASGPGAGTPASLRGLPDAKDPPLDLADEDDLGRARALYDAMPLDAKGRAERRRELVAAYQKRIARDDSNEPEIFRHFTEALGLWDARELQGERVTDLELLATTAEDVFKRSSTRGADLEAVTALAVLRALHPGKAESYEKTWKDILTYTDELAVAEDGPGAERARAVIMLETVTDGFPSRWAGDKLIELYLARQEGVVKSIAGGGKQDVVGGHRDAGIMRPVWNLVRIYARMRRLAEAPPVVEKLAGQFGDEPEVRKRLAEALAGDEGKDWLALMAVFVPSSAQQQGDADTALLICEEGAARLPRAIEPRKCAAEIARVTDRAPLALRWIEEARKLDPSDRDSAEIAARLYIVRVADLTVAERLDAARGRMAELEAFFKEVTPRFKDEPLEISLADAYTVYGRGLTTQGHVDDGVRALERAQKLEPSPAVVEELATVALKTGRYADALAGYEKAAEAPRETPIETAFEGNRLRRLAGEAAFLAGDHTKATILWKAALKEWTDILGPQLSSRARSAAYVEVGRLYHHLGEPDKSVQSMNSAIDADPEQGGIYGEVIAFLVTRGHHAEALDAYHRALGRAEVTEYLRAYTSLWMVDLARLRGVEPESSSLETLEGLSDGTRWYQRLAAFKLGKVRWEELLEAADTRGKRAEAYFYEAMNRLARGDRATGEQFLNEVLNTKMLGFFEYDMARYYLRFGAPGGDGKR